MTPTEPPTGKRLPPLDIATMRASIASVLPPEVTPTDSDTLQTLTGLIRGHMELAIPEIEQLTVPLPKDDVPRYCALACLGEARRKLSAVPGPQTYDAVVHARKLARSLLALCDHYETLTGVRMCLACDHPIHHGQTTLPYTAVNPTKTATSTGGRIHNHCASTLRSSRPGTTSQT